MRLRIKTGQLVGSTNMETVRRSKKSIIIYKYIERLGGNKIIKTIIK